MQPQLQHVRMAMKMMMALTGDTGSRKWFPQIRMNRSIASFAVMYINHFASKFPGLLCVSFRRFIDSDIPERYSSPLTSTSSQWKLKLDRTPLR